MHSAIATTPTIVPPSKPGQRKETTFYHIILYEKSFRRERRYKKRKLNYTEKDNRTRATEDSNVKGKVYKRKVLQETPSETGNEENQHVCNNDIDDEIDDDGGNCDKCIIYQEFERNNEMRYHCRRLPCHLHFSTLYNLKQQN